MLVGVALPRREVGALHPLVLFREVRLGMPREGFEARREVLVAAREQRIDQIDELAVRIVHRPVAEEIRIGPGELRHYELQESAEQPGLWRAHSGRRSASASCSGCSS